MFNNREEIQLKAAQSIYDNKFNCIADLSPRVGKSRLTLLALEKLSKPINILISAPFNTILVSWKAEILKWGSKHNFTFTNNRSLDNIDFDAINLIILDECHYSSTVQRNTLREAKKPIIGLTGSLGKDSRIRLKQELGIKPCFVYSIEEAIQDGIISDFKINIHYVELDNKVNNIPYGTKKDPKIGTELQAYTFFSNSFERFKFMSYGNPALGVIKMKYAGDRSRVIYNSINKIKLTKKLSNNRKKTLIFTAQTKVADLVCKHSYHSKSTENNLELFADDKINKLSVVNQVSMGVTIKGLKHIIVNQLQSSEEMSIQKIMRAMNFEEGKLATVDIIVVKNTVDEDWVVKALSWVNKDKITYIN